LRGHDSWGIAAFSPDGKRVVTATRGDARIWDAATAKEIAVLPYSANSAAFSADGMRIVTALGKTARIWDAANA
jgi:WD40 repeat protein